MTVYDGIDPRPEHIVAELSGTSYPNELKFHTQNGGFVVTFESDGDTAGGGWEAYYSIEQDGNCKGGLRIANLLERYPAPKS